MYFRIYIDELLNKTNNKLIELRHNGDLTDTKKNKLTGVIETLKALKKNVDIEYIFETLKI